MIKEVDVVDAGNQTSAVQDNETMTSFHKVTSLLILNKTIKFISTAGFLLSLKGLMVFKVLKTTATCLIGTIGDKF